MAISNNHTRQQDDLTVTLDTIEGRITQLDSSALTHALAGRSADDLTSLQASVATLTAAVEEELRRRKQDGQGR